MPHIVYVVTAPETALAFLRGQLVYMRDAGWQVSLICSADERVLSFADDGIVVESVQMIREPALGKDLRSLWNMRRAIKSLNPDLISYGTPKAALLASIASWWLRVPERVYVLRGLRAEGLSGLGRHIAIRLEKLVSRLSTHVLCVSHSLLEVAVQSKAIDARKAEVIGSGGSNGVDCDRFSRNAATVSAGRKLRDELGIPDSSLVVGFVGRMVIDKGVRELMDAFTELAANRRNIFLVMVGSREEVNGLPDSYWKTITSHPQVAWLGSSDKMENAYCAMDLLALPSYREGLPNVVLEAGAMELPCVVSNVTGAADAIVPETTGLYCEARSAPSLLKALERYLSDPQLRSQHGAAARSHVVNHYSNEVVWAGFENRYRQLLH